MEQLFTNLLSNALKYVAPKESPNIRILSEKVHREQIPYDFVKSAEHYCKITIADSGIGFDNVQANKIFDLLKRLHHGSEYSGTGIGLAICKKIIENHHGFILATSELGKGSAFILYLPAQAR
jgi:signal transduction histidine kinase